jgi:dTDP-4-dehydrorhamnose 3,5-epimerase
VLLEPVIHSDERGFFLESYREETLAALGIAEQFVQENHSRSTYGVVRGMHFQVDPPMAKLVRCARGAIVDVLVDIRPASTTFGEWEAYELDDRTLRVLYVPPGFAHGFCVVSEVADVLYKQTRYWRRDLERGFSVDDAEVGIVWPVSRDKWLLSDRDRNAPPFSKMASSLDP